jgi:hypothetical protein
LNTSLGLLNCFGKLLVLDYSLCLAKMLVSTRDVTGYVRNLRVNAAEQVLCLCCCCFCCFAAGAREEAATSYEDLVRILDMGALARATGNTAMNELSSRSHAIFTIIVEQSIGGQQQTASQTFVQDHPQERIKQGYTLNSNGSFCSTSSTSSVACPSFADKSSGSPVLASPAEAPLSPRARTGGSAGALMEYRCAKFHLVDLAGSERTKRSGVVGTRFKEAVTINQVWQACHFVLEKAASP